MKRGNRERKRIWLAKKDSDVNKNERMFERLEETE